MNSKLSLRFLCALCCLFTTSFLTSVFAQEVCKNEIGYSVNDTEKRYEIINGTGLRAVAEMLNTGTAVYKTVYLPNGIYDLYDEERTNRTNGVTISASDVTLIGESHDARIIGLFKGIKGSTINLRGDNIIVRNLSIESTVPTLRGVAPALAASGDNIFFDKVKLIGGQDTYVGGSNKPEGCRKLFHECIIVGTVDFICNGGANTLDYFLRCDLQLKEGGVIAAPQGMAYFRDCTVSDYPGYKTADNKFSLARPWRTTGKAFFINTTFNVMPTWGFTGMGGGVFKSENAGTTGNLNVATGTLFEIVNPPQDPQPLQMSEEDIKKLSSISDICGPILATLVSE